MARDRRMICRSSFTSKKLAKCTDAEHLLFYGLVLNADDEGRGDGDPVTLTMLCANRRWSEKRAEQMMDKLRTLRLVSWYTVDGNLYYEVVDFDRYQQGSWQGKHKKESIIPAEKYARKHQPRCTGTPEPVTPDTDCVAKLMECNVMESVREESDVGPSDTPLFAEGSDPYDLASFLRDCLLTNDEKSKVPDLSSATFQKWCLSIDRLIRLDRREPEVVAAIIHWCQDDSFWGANIQSADKLRKQFSRLYLQAKEAGASLRFVKE